MDPSLDLDESAVDAVCQCLLLLLDRAAQWVRHGWSRSCGLFDRNGKQLPTSAPHEDIAVCSLVGALQRSIWEFHQGLLDEGGLLEKVPRYVTVTRGVQRGRVYDTGRQTLRVDLLLHVLENALRSYRGGYACGAPGEWLGIDLWNSRPQSNQQDAVQLLETAHQWLEPWYVEPWLRHKPLPDLLHLHRLQGTAKRAGAQKVSESLHLLMTRIDREHRAK